MIKVLAIVLGMGGVIMTRFGTKESGLGVGNGKEAV